MIYEYEHFKSFSGENVHKASILFVAEIKRMKMTILFIIV